MNLFTDIYLDKDFQLLSQNKFRLREEPQLNSCKCINDWGALGIVID